jgi:phytol kinase
MNAWVGIITVMSVLLAAIGLLRWYQAAHKPHPEVVRKMLHVIMGGVTITFPWVFSQVWPVWLLAIVSALTLSAIKYLPALKQSVGSVVCSVNRQTYGELCFPLAVAILFTVAHSQPLLYCVPMAILAIADASSALVGMFYGSVKYTTADGNKTVEGSLTFFIIASLATALPLTVVGLDPAHTVLLSLLLGCLVTMFEAIAWHGLDNLFIPLSACGLLQTGLTMPVDTLAQQLAVACFLLAAAIAWRRRTALNDSAVLGAGLFCYLSWAIGGLPWLVAPLTILAAHRFILPAKYRRRDSRPHTIHEVIWVTCLGSLWLWLSKAMGADDALLLPYTLTYAAHLAVIGAAHASLPQAKALKSHAVLQSSISSWLALFVPYSLMTGLTPSTITFSVCALFAMLICAAAFCAVHRGAEDTFHTTERWAQQTGLVAACSAAVFAVLQFS